MAKYQRSTLINANRFTAGWSHVLKAVAKKAKKEIKERKLRAARKRGLTSS
jgi:hypothetical protein